MADTYLTRQTLLKKLKLRLDESSWDEFVLFYEPLIHSVIRRFGAHNTEVEDISQQILLKIWSSIDKFNVTQKKGGFRNWIYTIAKNTTINQLNKSKRNEGHKEQLIKSSKGDYVEPEIDSVINEEWNKHITSIAIERVGKKVSKKAMDAFSAQFSKETIEETAERLGLEVATIYSYRGRIKERLIAEIKNLKEMLE